MLQINKLPNGNLEMRIDRTGRGRIKQIIAFFGGTTYSAEAAFLADELQCRNTTTYQQTAPCSVGALIDAPIITDGADCWGFMNYQVESFLEVLARGDVAVWQKG